jgi:hypothetical protein
LQCSFRTGETSADDFDSLCWFCQGTPTPLHFAAKSSKERL